MPESTFGETGTIWQKAGIFNSSPKKRLQTYPLKRRLHLWKTFSEESRYFNAQKHISAIHQGVSIRNISVFGTRMPISSDLLGVCIWSHCPFRVIWTTASASSPNYSNSSIALWYDLNRRFSVIDEHYRQRIISPSPYNRKQDLSNWSNGLCQVKTFYSIY